MTEETSNKLKEIKRSFRLLMNGVASHSMREKGVDYKINWGVGLAELNKMAERYGKDYELAIELWKEDIRECKILATLIMPAERMLPEITCLWVEQTRSQEIAEIASMNLYWHLDYAPVLAFRWIASDNDICQICGYNILSRLFMNGRYPNERGINEFIDQAVTALQGAPLSVRHAAITCMRRFASMGDNYTLIAEKALKSVCLELF